MRVHRGRAAALLGCGFLMTCAAVLVNRRAKPWTGPIPAEAPSEPPAEAALPVTFEVSARGAARPDGLLECGVPLPRGAVRADTPLRLTRDDVAVPARITPLARWEDGSLRWARLVAPVPLAEPEATARLTLAPGAPTPLPAPAPAPPPLTLSVDGDGPDADIAREVEVEPLTPTRIRVRLQATQRRSPGRWRTATLRVGDPAWTAAIVRGPERGVVVERTEAGTRLALLPAPLAIEEGERLSWIVILERGASPDDLAARVSAPLRARFPAAYVRGTGAAPRAAAPPALVQALEATLGARLAAQQDPSARGPRGWGDLVRAEAEDLSLLGATDQRGDPAAAALQLHAAGGGLLALDAAVDAARRQADALGDRGAGSHDPIRAALERALTTAMVTTVTKRWRSDPETPAEPGAIVDFVKTTYGPKAGSTAEAVLGELQRVKDPARKERRAAILLASDLLKRIRARIGPVARPRDYADRLLESKELKRFALGLDRDAIFAPFFARHGGSWEAFPTLGRIDRPRETDRHRGGDAPCSGLVLAHLWTGDLALRRAALRVARYHVDALVPREVRAAEEAHAQGRRVDARHLGRPLLNLLDLIVLTEGQPDRARLHQRIEQSIWSLVAALNKLPPERYAGPEDLGEVGEGLARYHERTRDDAARRTLIRAYRWWCSRGWRKDGFRGPRADEVRGLSAYGLCYAAWQADDPRLARRARTILASLETPPESPLALGFRYRNALQAARLLDLLPQAAESGP